jgi:hypothetical protein
MDWAIAEGSGRSIGTRCHRSYPKQEVSLVSFTLHLSAFTRQQLYRHLQHAYTRGALRLAKRMHALRAFVEGRAYETSPRCCLWASPQFVITAPASWGRSWPAERTSDRRVASAG